MPEKPTWEFIKQAADKMTDKAAGVYGICLRGKPGWGENMAFLTATSNSFGARWFDEKWEPQFNSPEWKATLDYYVPLMKADGPPGASSNGFNENLALFDGGKCGMWIDATVAAGLIGGKDSKVAGKVGYALAPDNGLGKRGNWLWAWSLGIPAGTKNADAAQKFISWATGKHYDELVASKLGWGSVPPGTRTSLYKNADYLKAAPFAQMTLDSINSADPIKTDGEAGSLYWRPVRRDPRVPGHRHRRRAGLLCRARRNHDRRRRAREGSGLDRGGDEEGRLHQVSPTVFASRSVSARGGLEGRSSPSPPPSRSREGGRGGVEKST